MHRARVEHAGSVNTPGRLRRNNRHSGSAMSESSSSLDRQSRSTVVTNNQTIPIKKGNIQMSLLIGILQLIAFGISWLLEKTLGTEAASRFHAWAERWIDKLRKS